MSTNEAALFESTAQHRGVWFVALPKFHRLFVRFYNPRGGLRQVVELPSADEAFQGVSLKVKIVVGSETAHGKLLPGNRSWRHGRGVAVA